MKISPSSDGTATTGLLSTTHSCFFPPSLLWFWTLIGSSSQLMVLQLGAQSDRCTRLLFSGLLVTRTALWKFIIDEPTVDNCECLKIVSKPSCGMLKASGCFRCTQLTHTVSVWWVKMQRFGRQLGIVRVKILR